MTPIAIALLLGQGPAPDLQAPITFTHRAAPVGRVLAQLSEKSKLKLEALPAVASDVVLVSVKDVPLQAVLERIATVTSAEWRQDGDVYRLAPAAGIRNREAQDEATAKVTAIRASIAERLKPPAPMKSTGDAEVDKEMASFQDNMMGDKPILRILQNVDLRALSTIGPNERVVFSTQPTRMQHPLPANSGTQINLLVAEHNKTAKAMNNADKDADDAMPPGVEMPDFVKEMIEQRTKPVGEVSKGLLIVSRMGFGGFGGLNVELVLYNREGKVAYKNNTMLTEQSAAMTRAIENAQGKTPAAGKKTPVELSPDTKVVQSTFRKATGMTGSFAVSPEAKALLYRPDVHDPLSFASTDSLLAVAKKQGRPIIANLPDAMEEGSAFMMGPSGDPMVEDIESDLKSAEHLRTIADPTFLLVKPSQPAAARQDRLDRAALAALMQAVDKKGIPTLDDIAAYATKASNPMEGGIGASYVAMLAPGAFSMSMSGFTNWDALRFYGLLSPEARQNLAGGGRIAFGTLNPALSGQLQKMVFGTQANLQVEGTNQKPEAETMASMMRMFGVGADRDFRTEPTEAMPNGLPADGFVSANVANDFFVSPVFEGDQPTMGPMSVLGVDEIAMFKMIGEDTRLNTMMGDRMPKIDRVKLGERSVWNLQFHVAQRISAKATLNDNRMPKNGATVAMTSLPAGHQSRIAERVAQYKKSPLGALGGMMGGLGGGQTPPPTP